MEKYTLIVFSFLLSISTYSQELTKDEKLKLANLEKAYSTGNYIETDYNAWLYYRSGIKENYQKADIVLNKFISRQDSVPQSITYGQWGLPGKWNPGDLNLALFHCHEMFVNLWDQQNKMSPPTRAKYLNSCKRLLEAAKGRWDYEVFDIHKDYYAYSNIFGMYIQTLMLAGERFNDPVLKRTAKSQWTRWYNHISYFGIDEFNSTNYNYILFKALIDIHDFCHDEKIQSETKEVIDQIYLLQSAINHPVLKLLVSGVSRNYREFIEPGDARCEVLNMDLPEYYVPPQKAVEINKNRKYPFEVTGKAKEMPFIFKSYQLPDAAMGSMTGGCYLWHQIHCIAAAGRSENERAVAFLQGTHSPVNGFTDQKALSTLCVYNTLPTLRHLYKWKDKLSNYKETIDPFGIGITKGWKEKMKTPDHIILEAYGYDLHIFPFAVKEEKIVPCDLIINHRTTTSLRYHPVPRIFDEYTFPSEPEWFGAYITIVKSGTKVRNPGISYTNQDGIRTFRSYNGHLIRLVVSEKGDTKQLYNVDPALIPLLKFTY